MPSVDLNISLFAHIELDSELAGRFAVQGNTFSNTFGYLNQYLKTLSNQPAHIDKLAVAMEALVTRENVIHAIADKISLDIYTRTTTDDIAALKPGTNLLVPGGWEGVGSPGHAMIYQFEKNAEGTLLFSIYNSGAGLNRHDKTSSTTRELYAPVMTHQLPHPVDIGELQALITKLTIPQLASTHPSRNKREFDEDVLYNNIETSLRYLNATVVPQDLNAAHMTTAGQISGTCAQRSIHQMLKINFGNLPGYQRFIFDFKMHALHEFIRMHPAPPRNPVITAFIQKAVTNNLRILQKKGLFETKQEHDTANETLYALQRQLKQDLNLVSSNTDPLTPPPPILSWSERVVSTLFPPLQKNRYEAKTIQHPIGATLNLASFNSPSNPAHSTHQLSICTVINPNHLLNDIEAVIKTCEKQLNTDPVWVMEQIEQMIVRLPIPKVQQKTMPCYETLPFYTDIKTKQQFEMIENHLEALQSLYLNSSQKVLGEDAIIPNQLVTQWSLLALRDYFDVTGASITQHPSYHRYTSYALNEFLQIMNGCPFAATNNPVLDQRLVELTELMSERATYREIEKEYLPHYQAIINTEPALKKQLEAMYQQQYGQDNSPLHSLVRQCQYAALYIVFKEFGAHAGLSISSALSTAPFKPLITKITRQLNLERYIKKGLWQSDNNFAKELRIDTHDQTQFGLSSTLYLNRSNYSAFDLNQPRCITHHKYNVTESPAGRALLVDYQPKYITPSARHLRSNQIQLLSHDKTEVARVIENDDYFTRDLFHLRTSPAHQVNVTLDYFSKTESIDKLGNFDNQRYVEANLFEPGLLSTTLKSDTTFLPRLDAFIQKGLRHFANPDGLLSNESLFFIRLRLYVHRFAALDNAECVPLLLGDMASLNTLIASHTDSNSLASLHNYRFLTAVTLHQLSPSQNNALLNEALLSCFHLQAKQNQHIPEDTASRVESQRAIVYFKEWLQKNRADVIQPLLLPLMDSLNLDVAHLTLTGTYPIYQFQDMAGSFLYGTTLYTIDVEQGRVFQEGLSLSSIPLDIKNHPVMAQLGLDQASSCFISPDKNTVLFEHPNIRIKKEESNLLVQKKWSVDGGAPAWYQLNPLSDKQRQLFGLKSMITITSMNAIPPILADGSMQAWINPTRSFNAWINGRDSIIVQNKRPVYHIDTKGVMHQLDQNGLRNGRLLSTPPPTFAQALTQFEDPGFFTVNLDETQPQGSIHFARYGFELNLSEQQLTLPDTTYALMPSEPSPMGADVASLQFSNGTEQQCVVAFQPFYVDEKTTQTPGHYYKLTHDISGHIPREQLKKYWKNKNIAEADQPIWNHHDSARSITYRMICGAPKPDTAADALYLCYLYLGTHDIQKAWAVLEDISKRLSFNGSMQELTCLSWIVQALPVLIPDENGKKDGKSTLKTPEYIACQLKAMALYTEFLKLGNPPTFPENQAFDLTRANGHYDALCLKETQTFYAMLPATIYTLYLDHQKNGRHLDEKYTLCDDECKSLLNYCDPHQLDNNKKPVAWGALGYERRRLSLKTLLNEYQRLDVFKNTSGVLTAGFFNRITDIRNQIKTELRVAKKSTTLERVSFEVTFQGNFYKQMNAALLSSEAKTIYDSWKHNLSNPVSMSDMNAAINALFSGIEQDDFITHFPAYFKIALSGNEIQKQQLEVFCTRYLIAHRHQPLNKQDTNIPYLSSILYGVLANPIGFTKLVNNNSSIALWNLNDWLSDAWYRGGYYKLSLPPPIELYQAKDVYEDILTHNKAIWDALRDELSVHTPMPDLEPIYTMPLTGQLGIEAHCKAYRQEDVAYQLALKELIISLKGSNSTPKQIQLAEQTAGELQRQCMHAQRRIAEDMLCSPKTRAALTRQLAVLRDQQASNLATIWETVTELANKATRDQSHVFYNQVAASQRHTLTKQELLTLYLQADLAVYLEKTGLSKTECEHLHRRIHEGICLEVQHQQAIRVLKALKQAENSPEPHHLHTIADSLISETISEAQSDPALMLFQYEEDKLIRPRQAEALSTLLSNPDCNNSVEKVIMGGGKSKVILPLLVAKKATGLNLVVVEVPRAMLATNHVDLNSTSQRLFGQKGHRFEFDRDSDCSAERLAALYQTFVDIMTNKEYLVTTGEAIQSLELKYLELILFKPEEPEKQKQWKKQVYWASKITGLLKQCGDVVIDEMHQGLLLKKKLNYTVGDQLSIDPGLIEKSIALYQFVDCLESRILTPEQLISHPESPLKVYIDLFKQQSVSIKQIDSEDINRQFTAYFMNQSESALLNAASNEIKDTFAFYKEQLTLLPQTQARHYKEHYGPSERQPSALKRALAIPYAASNKPNERSRFGNPLEIINYSIQSLLTEGLNEVLLKEVIQQWQLESRNELLADAQRYTCMDETPTAQRVNQFLKFTGFSLQTINLRAEGHLSTLHEQMRHHRSLLFTLLKEKILPQLTVDPSILHSDAYNHVDIYRSGQGLSGTPWNYSTWHQRLNYNPNTSLGTDGYIQAVLKEKSTPVSQASFKTIDAFLAMLFKDKHNVRAIIDVSATFAGFSNIEVARCLARHAVGQNTPKPIQYILYFNEADVLCALNVLNNKTSVLATSDPDEIDQKLGCTPDARLTYYDQSHTVGVDLKQSTTAHGIVLADSRTHLQSFLQGCMRMRGLDNQQTITIIVPEDTNNSLEELMDLMINNEQTQLREDNFFAAIAKMNNVVRQAAIQRLADVPDEEVDIKYQITQTFQRYFIETNQRTLFEQYGGVYAEQDTGKLLDQYRMMLIQDWHSSELDDELQAIVKQAIPLCKPMSMNRVSQTQGREVEQETLKEVSAEKEMMKEDVCFDSTLKEKQIHAWTMTEVLQFHQQGSLSSMHPLATLCPHTTNQQQIDFPAQLLADDNYAQVYDEQQQMLCPYLKPALAILFRQQGNDVTACLISMTDADKLHGQLDLASSSDTKLWISTTQHTLLEGTFPKGIMNNSNYQSLVEQIRFFNGELNGLCEQKEPFHWLTIDTSDKLNYFEQHILPYRQTTPSELKQLQSMMQQPLSNHDEDNVHANMNQKIITDVAGLERVLKNLSPAAQATFITSLGSQHLMQIIKTGPAIKNLIQLLNISSEGQASVITTLGRQHLMSITKNSPSLLNILLQKVSPENRVVFTTLQEQYKNELSQRKLSSYIPTKPFANK